jgi:MerR family transcriptional regulator, copper efflux regulator
MTTHAPLTISAVARQARVPLDTIRYYERRGLLPVPPRSAGGYRQYSPDAVRRLTFIKRAQALGFTLEEIAELLALQAVPDGTCGAVERRARAAMRRIETKLDELTRMRDAISRLATACRSAHPADECPMLTALDEDAARDGADAPSG